MTVTQSFFAASEVLSSAAAAVAASSGAGAMEASAVFMWRSAQSESLRSVTKGERRRTLSVALITCNCAPSVPIQISEALYTAAFCAATLTVFYIGLLYYSVQMSTCSRSRKTCVIIFLMWRPLKLQTRAAGQSPSAGPRPRPNAHAVCDAQFAEAARRLAAP